MNESDIAAFAEWLHAASDEQRFARLREAARDRALRDRLLEAQRILAAASAGRPAPDPDETAVQLARGRVSRDAIADRETLQWLLECLVEPLPQSASSEHRVSSATRKSLQRITRPRTPAAAPRLVWMPALGALAAALFATVILWSPAADPWARSLDLSRGRVLRLSTEHASAARRAVEQGTLAAALFDLPAAPSRTERDASTRPAQPLTPRWEAVSALRPQFRWQWTPGAEETFEVVLLAADRTLVWSGEVSGVDRLDFPTDLPALEPGATYYWKVNREQDGRLVASPYVGFRTLEPARKEILDRDLRNSGDSFFLRGIAYDRQGLYTEAVREFELAAENPERRPVASKAMNELRRKQGFDE